MVTLNGDLVTLDGQYNTLSDIVAKGERDNYNQEFLSQISGYFNNVSFEMD